MRIDDLQVAELLDRMGEAAAAYIRGDIRRYLELFDHPDDYSLMPPSASPVMVRTERTRHLATARARRLSSMS